MALFEQLLVAGGRVAPVGAGDVHSTTAAAKSRIATHVYVRERTPSLADQVAARVTYPYRLITIPRTSKPTSLVFIGR